MATLAIFFLALIIKHTVWIMFLTEVQNDAVRGDSKPLS